MEDKPISDDLRGSSTEVEEADSEVAGDPDMAPGAAERRGYLGSLAGSRRVEMVRTALSDDSPLPIQIQAVAAQLHRQARRLRGSSIRTAL